MRFDKTNIPLRSLNLQDNLWGDFTNGWNLITSNTLGFRLVNGSIDGLIQIDPSVVWWWAHELRSRTSLFGSMNNIWDNPALSFWNMQHMC